MEAGKPLTRAAYRLQLLVLLTLLYLIKILTTVPFPLGSQAFIDPKTGVISGIAPPAGKYVITVCVGEYR